MARTETLEQIAKLLPQPQREEFFAMIAKFKSVPDDDEYLQILHGIGFMTLIWKEIPGEIRAVLKGANPVSETCHSVAKQVREAVIEAIPSYDDLKSISTRLQEHELVLSRVLRARHQPTLSRSPALILALALLAGILLGAQLHSHITPFFPW